MNPCRYKGGDSIYMDYSFGSVTRLRARRLRNLCSIPDEDNKFVSYPKLPDCFWAQLSYSHMRTGGGGGVKTSEPEVDHSPASSAEVRICLWLCLNLDSTQYFVCRGAQLSTHRRPAVRFQT